MGLVKKSCSVTVLSVDHKSGVEGKYFNFAKKDLDAILGRTNWSSDRLKVSNGKEVVVWRNPNGGSKGDAHGRKEPKMMAMESDWSVGDRITIKNCLSKKETKLKEGDYCGNWYPGECG